MKEETHLFQGLKRDNHQIRQDGNFLWDAHNIRLTNRNDSTFLSITNERGTSNPLVDYTGKYVGHCVIGKYLVVFTSDGNDSYIYRTEVKDSRYHTIILYKGNLELSPEHPIQTLGIIEHEKLSKVYWIDDIHQPRYIIITIPELKSLEASDDYSEWYNISSFDFVCSLKLNETVQVDKLYGSGIFSPGTIQYACTYYNKFGQESNIFFTTPLQYISFKERAGSPEDRIANSFRITIKGVDKSFGYIRVYSIHRTSIDTVPTVKQLPDISIGEEDEVTIIDTGVEGSIVEPTMLLYVGGRSIIAGCLAQKNNTLFLGNISLDNSDTKFIDYVEDTKSSISLTKNREIRKRVLSYPRGNYYIPDIDIEEYSARFKTNETYRIGIQAQLSNGTWTSPVHITDDVLTTLYPSHNYNFSGSITKDEIIQYGAALKVPHSIVEDLNGIGVKKLRACVVFPATYERDVICQGILNPTVYNGVNRSKNSPFAQASWFFRPSMPFNPGGSITRGVIEFKHNHSLFVGESRGQEIQSMVKDGTINEFKSIGEDTTNFYIDENIVTLNSPDIEFDTNISHLDLTNTKLRIVGYVELSSIYGDIDINTSSPAAGMNAEGFVHKMEGFRGDVAYYNTGNGGLISPWCYKDAAVYKKVAEKEDGKEEYKVINENKINTYRIFAFNRNGSLNNDVNRGDNGTRTAVLSKKVISNLKVFDKFTPVNLDMMDINTPQIFSDNELSILKLDIDYLNMAGSNISLSGVYQGNIDTLLSPDKEYPIQKYPKYSEDYFVGEWKSKEPIRMKYKSTPHMLFRFTSDRDHQTLLPRHIKVGSPGSSINYPGWIVENNPYKNSSDKDVFEGSPNYIGAFNYFGLDLGSEEYPGEDLTREFIGELVFGYYDSQLSVGEIKEVDGEVKFIPKELSEGNIYKLDTNTIIKVRVSEAGNINSEIFDVYTIFDDPYNYEEYTIVDKDKGFISTNVDKYVTVDSNGALSRANKSEVSGEKTSNKVIYNQGVFGTETDTLRPYLLIAELIKERPVDSDGNPTDTKFGGTSEQALMDNLWVPASDPVSLDDIGEDGSVEILCKYGDTWYSRYDCLKTYPFTKEDTNQIVEIGSFMCETRVNLNGRWDRNKGQLSNLNVSPENFNKLNEVYSQKDNFFNYRIFDKDYYSNQCFPNQITWSKEKTPGGELDTWTNVTVANTMDLDGSKGKITAIKIWNENILLFQEKALSMLLFNSRVQIPTSDGVPIEVSNGYKVDGSRILSSKVGCRNPWSIVTSSQGIYFLDSRINDLFLFNGELSNLSAAKGMSWWARQNINALWKPSNAVTCGIRSFYDEKFKDVYFTPNSDLDALCFSEQLGHFSSFLSYGGTQAMFNFADGFYSLRESNGSLKLYQNNVGKYNIFYGEPKGWSFSFISNENPTYTKIFDTVELRTDHYENGETDPLNSCPLSFIKAENEYQKASAMLDKANMRKKFRVWRGFIPRNTGTRERIRNPWSMITLGWTPEDNDENNQLNLRKAIIHDVSVKYTV